MRRNSIQERRYTALRYVASAAKQGAMRDARRQKEKARRAV
jgi:hypothetical protein